MVVDRFRANISVGLLASFVAFIIHSLVKFCKGILQLRIQFIALLFYKFCISKFILGLN